MANGHDESDPDLNAIFGECSRIGFDMHELGGLAFSDRNGFAAFLDLLRGVPSGVGLEGFRQRMRNNGVDLWTANEERLELEAEDGTQATSCSFCGRSKTGERKLVHGQNGVAICNECVRLATAILE